MAIEESCTWALRTTSVSPPAHYILNIQQFSLLTKQNVELYESNEFEAAGYKWKFMIHPNGNKSKDAGEFLSVYLTMAKSRLCFAIDDDGGGGGGNLSLCDGDGDGDGDDDDDDDDGGGGGGNLSLWENLMILEMGILLETTVFGAEVFVSKETSKGKTECLSMVKDAILYKHTWKISLNEKSETFNIFIAVGYKWKILLYTDGDIGVGDDFISLSLALADPENLPSGTKILAEFTLRILDQLNARHHDGKATIHFTWHILSDK